MLKTLQPTQKLTIWFLLVVALIGGWYLNKTYKELVVKPKLYFGFDVRLGTNEDEKLYQPLMEYLSQKTGYNFQLRFTKQYEDTQENLGKDYVQFAAMGAVSFIKSNQNYHTQVLVRGLNEENKAQYQSIIFTTPNSDIKTIEDIKGKSFAFGSTDSTQGHLIPREMLNYAGIDLQDLSEYRYTGSHQNAVNAVISGQFAAGGAQDTLVRSMANQGKVKIIKESNYYPSSGIVANQTVDPKIIQAVKKALLELDPQGKHQNILPNWDKTEMPNGFIEASPQDYLELENLMKKYDF